VEQFDQTRCWPATVNPLGRSSGADVQRPPRLVQGTGKWVFAKKDGDLPSTTTTDISSKDCGDWDPFSHKANVFKSYGTLAAQGSLKKGT
jgi:hypothetical protein